MSLKNIKKININLMALTLAIFLAFVYFIVSSFAWFTDDSEIIELGEVAQIEMQLLDGNNQLMTTAPSFTYNGAATNNLVVKVKNMNTSTINAIVRVMIVTYWSDGAPTYISEMGENTVEYTFNTGWIVAAEVGYDYVYYDGVVSPDDGVAQDETVDLLIQINFPTLPPLYNGKTLTLSMAVEGLQANGAGINLWSEQSQLPIGWDPLA